MTHKHPRCVLVTGGAGYIGSHVLLALADAGIPAAAFDNLSTGRADAIPGGLPLIRGDVCDRRAVEAALSATGADAVVHMAARISVPDSLRDPLGYHRTNVLGTIAVLDAAVAAGVRTVLLSSTAAVYGAVGASPVPEGAPLRPLSPYGSSKAAAESVLCEAAAAHGLAATALRYFNVAGADSRGRTGPRAASPAHLIGAACDVALGLRSRLDINGRGHPTPDGTCVRDYIHVSDLADAHLAALVRLHSGSALPSALNVGYGRGSSVLDVVRAVAAAAGAPLPLADAPPRPGDAPSVVADAALIRDALGWTPRWDDLGAIVGTALRWRRRYIAVETKGGSFGAAAARLHLNEVDESHEGASGPQRASQEDAP